MDYDVYLHDLVELVVVIPMSPRSSNSEFGFKSSVSFGLCVSAVFRLGGSTAYRSGRTAYPSRTEVPASVPVQYHLCLARSQSPGRYQAGSGPVVPLIQP